MNLLFKRAVFILILVFFSAGCNQFKTANSPAQTSATNYNHQLLVGGQILNVEVVSEGGKMEQGLSGKTKMADNEGMLFDFGNKEGTPGFWMKDMKFNLDFIWIDQNKIVGITANVPAPVDDNGLKIRDNDLPTYYPPSVVNQVLEVNSGWTEKNKIKTGDEVRLK